MQGGCGWSGGEKGVGVVTHRVVMKDKQHDSDDDEESRVDVDGAGVRRGLGW